jgi:Prohead core protein protease.
MKFLQELSEDVQIVTEAKEDGKKDLYISGVFMQCIPNRNGRIYPEHVMQKEVGRYLKEMVKANRAVGELGHPPNPKLNENLISHKITSLEIDGKNVMGKALVLNTPMGTTARGLIEGGVQLGVSSRGLGSLKEIKEGLKEVQDDFRLITAADIVMDPSAPDAFVNGIMENVDWFYDAVSGNWRQAAIAEETKKQIKTLSKRELEEAQLRLFEHYLAQISKITK